MKILIIHNFYQDPGGEDVVFKQEVEALTAQHEVSTLHFQNKKGLKGAIQFFLYPYNFLAGYKLKKQIKKNRPDVIHIHNIHYASGPILFRIVRKYKIPTVFTLHNFRLICPSANLFFNGEIYLESIGKTFPWDAVKKGVLDHSVIKTFWTALVYKLHKWLGTWKNIDRYLAMTPKAKLLILKGNLNIKETQITVKPNFISRVKWPKEIVKQPYILYIGRLSVEKGVKPLVKGFSLPGMPRLKIIGDGPLLKELKSQSTKNIEFLGFMPKDEVIKHLAGAHAVIIPSICYEGLPLSLLDALSFKIPVIISEKVIASEWISNNVNGFVIDPYSFDENVKAIMKKDNLIEIGENGYQLFSENFTEEKIIQKLNKVYSEISKIES